MENKLGLSDSLGIGIDISDGDDVAVMQIVRYTGNKCEVINTLYGEEAIWTYEHLTARPHAINLDLCRKPLKIDWIKVNPAISRSVIPEMLTKEFRFDAAGELSKLFSFPLKERITSHAQMLLEEMYPVIKINPKGEGDECV